MSNAYHVDYAPKAHKQLRKLDPQVRLWILDAVDAFAADPHGQQPQVKALKGDEAGAFRLRVADYRVVFDLYESELLVLVIEVAHCRDVKRYH